MGPRRLLIVEDSPDYAILVEEMLLESLGPGIEVIHGDTLSAAISALSEPASIDGVLLDLSLPDADGLEALSAVRQLAPDAPVVVLTGIEDEALAVRAVQGGAQDYLPKSSTDAGLLARSVRYAIERKRSELRFANQAAQSNRIRLEKEEAERANHAKSEFLSRMSHELRTPLHAILGFGELLEREELQPGQREKLTQMTNGAGHLLALINEALDLTAIESGQLRLSLEPVHTGELLQEALELIAPLAAARSLTISAPTVAKLDVHVMADRHRLKQALLNLLSNAVKYNRERGEITLTCTSERNGNLRIGVTDSGTGIAAADLMRVFEPFDRLGAEMTEVEGTGLGLALTKRLINAMHAEIGVESELGQGTTFWLELPIVQAPQPSPSLTQEEPPISSPRSNAHPRTVLYVEDNPSNIRLLQTILATRPEITLLVASRGRLGLELASAHQPSLILLDLNLPDISGEEVLRHIRNDPRTADIPVVMLSADATPEQIQRLRRAGADDYLTKPFGFEQLLTLIDRMTRSPT